MNGDSREIDELYGLEPVFEPDSDASAAVTAECFVTLACPWCGERLDVRVDVTAGARDYIDDCEICCQPMELAVELEDNGGLHKVRVSRVD